MNHEHAWEHLGGSAFGMYRCRSCLCFGYRGSEKIGKGWSKHVKPYICGVTGCGKWAVAKDTYLAKIGRPRKITQWRCANHREKGA